jgi:hypothetical protein
VSITTKGELKTALANWSGRTDLTARLDEFCTLAEQDIERNLRKKVVRNSAFSLNSAAVALPATCAELRSLSFNTSSRLYPLIQVTAATLAGLKRSSAGIPRYYAVVDNTVLLDVVPSPTVTAEIIYFEAFTPLASDGATNDVLTNAPDIYLFACMKELELYLEHDERNPLWSAKYQKAVEDENAARERAEFGAAPKAPQLPIVFG